MWQVNNVNFFYLFQNTFSQHTAYGSGYANNFGNPLVNKLYNPTVGIGPKSASIAANIETNQLSQAGLAFNLATGVAGTSPYGIEAIVPVVAENFNGYGGSGTGEVAVAGEMPVIGTTNIGGQVPVAGSVRFSGDVPAGGIISVAATCGCGFSGN